VLLAAVVTDVSDVLFAAELAAATASSSVPGAVSVTGSLKATCALDVVGADATGRV